MFNMTLWEPHNHMGNKYRVRVNVKWFPEGKKVFLVNMWNKSRIKKVYAHGFNTMATLQNDVYAD